MLSSSSTILAVGAAGKFAGLVVPELVKRGIKVRALIRDEKQGDQVEKRGAAEIAIGDLHDRASLDSALKGVDGVFYIAPAFMPDEARIGKGMVDAAEKAGVGRFVFSSVIHPILNALDNHSAKGPVEEAILETDMEYAILHPAMFFQNFAGAWSGVVKTGVFAEPWSTETRFTRVDYRDVAEVAAIALTEDRLNFGTYELCAKGNLNRMDVAMLMGEVLGRKVEAAKLNPRKPVVTSGNSVAEYEKSAIERMFDWYDIHGLLGNSLILRVILGREPRTLRSYFEELAAQPAVPNIAPSRFTRREPPSA